jgi:hypothetical protein
MVLSGNKELNIVMSECIVFATVKFLLAFYSQPPRNVFCKYAVHELYVQIQIFKSHQLSLRRMWMVAAFQETLKVHSHVHRTPIQANILSQFSPAQAFTLYSLTISHNITPPPR